MPTLPNYIASNLDDSISEYLTGGNPGQPSLVVTSIGALITQNGVNNVLSFNQSGSITASKSFIANILAVAGGGGGATTGPGGGGGYQSFPTSTIPAGITPVTIGAGGIGNAPGSNPGANTVIGSITALGGGGGGGVNNGNGQNGGSGGGAGSTSGTTQFGGIGSQGGNGGATIHFAAPFPAAGGGGASGNGQNSQNATTSGAGAAGISNSITGIAVSYAGGGGGGVFNNGSGTAALGGAGGGGNGSNSAAGGNGQSNTGGGGGGGSSGFNGGTGGSGIAIVSYAPTIPAGLAYAWGDSLTAGNQDLSGVANTYPNDLTVDFSLSKIVINQGVGGNTSSQILARFQALPSAAAFPTVIWSGRNNFASSAQVQSDIVGITGALTTSKYLVLSILNGNQEPSGSGNYTSIISLNTALASTHGAKYLDIRAILVALFNPANGVDVVDHGNDIPPFSLRAIVGSGTLVGTLSNVATTFTTSKNVSVGQVMTIGSEFILITGSGGTNVTSCTRGYGSSVAASYSNGQAYTVTDPLHLSAAGYAAVAQSVFNKITALGGW